MITGACELRQAGGRERDWERDRVLSAWALDVTVAQW